MGYLDALTDTCTFNVTVRSVCPPVEVNSIFVNELSACSNGADGSIIFFVSGGKAYEYSINDGVLWKPYTDSLVSGLTAGSYTISVRDTNFRNCPAAQSSPILLSNSGSGLVVFATATEATLCHAASSTGKIFVATEGGSGSYKYSLYDREMHPVTAAFAQNEYSGLPAGAYIVVATDLKTGCIEPSKPVRIESTDSGISVEEFLVENTECGKATGLVKYVVTSNDIYHYKFDFGAVFTSEVPSAVEGDTLTFENLKAGKHIFRVFNNCGELRTETEITNGENALTFEANKQNVKINCSTTLEGYIALDASHGEAPYKYRLDGGEWLPFVPENSTKDTIWNLQTGTYKLEMMDNSGCTYEINGLSIDREKVPALSIGTVYVITEPNCNHDGEIMVEVTGGSGNYEFSLDNGITYPYSGTITGLSAGYYTIKVRDAGDLACATAQTEFELKNNKASGITLDLFVVTQPTNCTILSGSFEAIIKGGIAPYYYKLNGSSGWTLLPANGIIANRPAGEYIVEVRDSGTPQWCTAGGKIHLTSPASTIHISDFSILKEPTCESATGAITFRVTGVNVNPTYYHLNDMEKVTIPAGSGAIILTGLPAGKHTLYVSDKCGDDTLTFELINMNNNMKVNVETEALVTDCDGNVVQQGRIIMTVNDADGTYSYKYRDDVMWLPFTNLPTDTIFVNEYGNYKVKVRDDVTGCIYTVYGADVKKEEDCSISVDIKIFLEGVVKPGTFATNYQPYMTNYIQDPAYVYKPVMPNFKLPVTNPYPIQGNVYPLINDPTGPAGKVVDWVWVEIWSNFAQSTDPGYEDFILYDVIEQQAFLLKTDGTIVDVDGNMPKFRPYYGNKVRIVVKHRNHLSVMSRKELDFLGNDILPYDFTTGTNQALGHIYENYPPMRMYSEVGVSCLWAGDLNQDDMIEPSDISMYEYGWRASMYGNYNILQDVNMDGFVNSKDGAFILQNFKYSVFSPAAYYIKR